MEQDGTNENISANVDATVAETIASRKVSTVYNKRRQLMKSPATDYRHWRIALHRVVAADIDLVDFLSWNEDGGCPYKIEHTLSLFVEWLESS